MPFCCGGFHPCASLIDWSGVPDGWDNVSLQFGGVVQGTSSCENCNDLNTSPITLQPAFFTCQSGYVPVVGDFADVCSWANDTLICLIDGVEYGNAVIEFQMTYVTSPVAGIKVTVYEFCCGDSTGNKWEKVIAGVTQVALSAIGSIPQVQSQAGAGVCCDFSAATVSVVGAAS